MKDHLILVEAVGRFRFENCLVGYAVVLNGKLIAKRRLKNPDVRRFPAEPWEGSPQQIAMNLKSALGCTMERMKIKTDKWWTWDDVELAVKGLLVVPQKDRKKLLEMRE